MIALAYAPQTDAVRAGLDANAFHIGVIVAPTASSVELAVAEYGDGCVVGFGVCVCVWGGGVRLTRLAVGRGCYGRRWRR